MDNYTPIQPSQIEDGNTKTTTFFLVIANVAAIVLVAMLFLIIQKKLNGDL